jgi:hypothetical protein
MAKLKVTFWKDFDGGANFGSHVRGDVIEIEQERAVSLVHRQIVVYGEHSYLKKEEKLRHNTKEEKQGVSTKSIEKTE